MLRTITESHSVTTELERLRCTFPRFDDWWTFGWSWRLARNPFIDATLAPHTNPQVYLIKTSPFNALVGLPFTLTFAYTVTENDINLFAVRYQDVTM